MEGSGSKPMGMFNPSAKVSIFWALPSGPMLERIFTESRGLVPSLAA